MKAVPQYIDLNTDASIVTPVTLADRSAIPTIDNPCG